MVTLFCFVYRLTTNRSSYAIVFGYKRVPFKYLWLRSFRFLFSYFIRGRILFMRGECRRSVTNDRTAALEELAYQDVDITVSTLRVCVWGGGVLPMYTESDPDSWATPRLSPDGTTYTCDACRPQQGRSQCRKLLRGVNEEPPITTTARYMHYNLI